MHRPESKFKWFDLTVEQEAAILAVVPKDLKMENLSDSDYKHIMGKERKK